MPIFFFFHPAADFVTGLKLYQQIAEISPFRGGEKDGIY
jgi:hypothetical protein